MKKQNKFPKQRNNMSGNPNITPKGSSFVERLCSCPIIETSPPMSEEEEKNLREDFEKACKSLDRSFKKSKRAGNKLVATVKELNRRLSKACSRSEK